MLLKNQSQLTRQLLGHFVVDGAYSAALIIDRSYLKEGMCYGSGDDEHPQITIPVDAEYNPHIPKFTELGYIQAGVYPSIDSIEVANQLSGKPYTDIDIPVYAVGQGEAHTALVIEVAEWVLAEEISMASYDFLLAKEEELGKSYDLYPPKNPEIWELPPNQASLHRHFFGYVTALGGGIVICDPELAWLVDDQHDFNYNQIISTPQREDAPGNRIGVMAYLPTEFLDGEFPVYGEYDGESLQRIIVEITDPEYPVNLIDATIPT